MVSCLGYPGLSERKLHGYCGLVSNLIVFLVAVSYSWQYGYWRWMSLSGCLSDQKASLSGTYAGTLQPTGLYSTHMSCSKHPWPPLRLEAHSPSPWSTLRGTGVKKAASQFLDTNPGMRPVRQEIPDFWALSSGVHNGERRGPSSGWTHPLGPADPLPHGKGRGWREPGQGPPKLRAQANFLA